MYTAMALLISALLALAHLTSAASIYRPDFERPIQSEKTEQSEQPYLLPMHKSEGGEELVRTSRYDRRCFFTPVNCVVYFKDESPTKQADFGAFAGSDERRPRADASRKRRRTGRARSRFLF